MRVVRWRLLAAGALTAILLDLPFPLDGPQPVWRALIAWFALVPLLAALFRLQSSGGGRTLLWSLLGGWFSGALWFSGNCYWVYNCVHIYGGMNAPTASFSMVIFGVYFGLWFGLFAFVLGLVQRAFPLRGFPWPAVLALPLLWVGLEYGLAHICAPRFPWDLLGYSHIDNRLLVQLAPWTGVSGISFILAAVNGLLAAWWAFRGDPSQFRGKLSPAASCGIAGLLVAAICSVGFLLKPSQPPSPTATAMLVQPNLDVASDDVWAGPEWDRHINSFRRLGAPTCKSYVAGIATRNAVPGPPSSDGPCADGASPLPALIVWPEAPAPFHELDDRFRSTMAEIAASDRAPLIVGDVGMTVEGRQFQLYNSASIVTLAGQFVGRYDKIHLVPFGEYIPARWLFFFAHQITQTMTDLTPGTERKTFRITSADGSEHRYGIFICYESVFGDEVRQFVRQGAEVLVNISDDGWYGDSSAPWQHLNMARMRAIENHRWLLRDTNNGLTASIDPNGTVRQSIPRHTVDALPARFGYETDLTFYARHGDLFQVLCAILGLVLAVWSWRRILMNPLSHPASS